MNDAIRKAKILMQLGEGKTLEWWDEVNNRWWHLEPGTPGFWHKVGNFEIRVKPEVDPAAEGEWWLILDQETRHVVACCATAKRAYAFADKGEVVHVVRHPAGKIVF